MLDIHPGNVVLEMPNLDGQSEEDILARLGSPICGPVITKGSLPQCSCLPHYVVQPTSFEKWVKEMIKDKDFNWKVKLIDFGAGGLPPHLIPTFQSVNRLFLSTQHSLPMIKNEELRHRWSIAPQKPSFTHVHLAKQMAIGITALISGLSAAWCV